MKSKLYLLLFIPALLVLTSCQKWMPENRIVGSWQLMYVDKEYQWGTEQVYTGYEDGVFDFSNNGYAKYSDYKGQLTGNWNMSQQSGGYYDSYGTWHNEMVNTLQLRLYGYNSNRVIEWEFNRIEMSGSTLVGYMSRFGNNYRYEFRRY